MRKAWKSGPLNAPWRITQLWDYGSLSWENTREKRHIENISWKQLGASFAIALASLLPRPSSMALLSFNAKQIFGRIMRLVKFLLLIDMSYKYDIWTMDQYWLPASQCPQCPQDALLTSRNALSVIRNENIQKVVIVPDRNWRAPILFRPIKPFWSISEQILRTNLFSTQPFPPKNLTVSSAESLIGFMICRTLGLQHFTSAIEYHPKHRNISQQLG